MTRGDTAIQWKALVKDGAELAMHRQVMLPAAFITDPGQTMDFEYRPTAPGAMLFQVGHRTASWKMRLPIRVDP